MRIDYSRVGVDLPEPGSEPAKTGRAGQAGQSGASGVGTGADTANSASGSAASGDETRFSFDQTKVQSLQAQVLAQPEIRAAKVGALQQSIGSGEYAIAPSQVAEAIVGELGGATG